LDKVLDHTPVLLREAVQALAVEPGGRYVDCTVGGSGHSAAILENSSPGGQLLAMDDDPEAVAIARKRLARYSNLALVVKGNFSRLEDICLEHGFFPVSGIILDLGLSSLQLSGDRGFSFQREVPLDMRFRPDQDMTADKIVNTYSEEKLVRILREYGEEVHSNRIASMIVKRRPLKTTLELAALVEQAYGGHRGKTHPATRTFQALRIAVNDELNKLKVVLRQAVNLLGFDGRLVVISYHSLEDRITKQFMSLESRSCICPPGTPVCICGHRPRLRLVNKKVVTPSPDEIAANPRSRSAKLRAAERIVDCGEPSGKLEGFSLTSRVAR
jgi:16S rRNA (cytosine1402-N4)-methyltransferase